ncbi:hypothetical protein [Hymenobacter daeguensis]
MRGPDYKAALEQATAAAGSTLPLLAKQTQACNLLTGQALAKATRYS